MVNEGTEGFRRKRAHAIAGVPLVNTYTSGFDDRALAIAQVVWYYIAPHVVLNECRS